jgi:aldose 1-epimerase
LIAPSGEQIEIAYHDQRAVIVEVGGGIRSYSVGGEEVFDGFEADEMSTSGRGQLLLGWPNRLEDGSYDFGGRRHQLPLTEPENHNAIRGLVRWASWRLREKNDHRVVMEHALYPQPGYPFSLAIRVDYELSDDGLTVRTTATNVGRDACPYGSGAHPYLTLPMPTIDEAIMRCPGRTVIVSDERGVPTGTAPVEGTELDFLRPRSIGSIKLDNAFTDLERDEDDLAAVELRDPNGGAAVTVWLDRAHQYVMIFTGDSLPDVNRRSLAVEPMTCPPNAFRTGEALIRLEPGRSFTAAWGIGYSDGT